MKKNYILKLMDNISFNCWSPLQVIFAIGRDPCTSSIGLDKVGVKTNK